MQETKNARKIVVNLKSFIMIQIIMNVLIPVQEKKEKNMQNVIMQNIINVLRGARATNFMIMIRKFVQKNVVMEIRFIYIILILVMVIPKIKYVILLVKIYQMVIMYMNLKMVMIILKRVLLLGLLIQEYANIII